MNHWACSGLDS